MMVKRKLDGTVDVRKSNACVNATNVLNVFCSCYTVISAVS